MSLDLNSSKAEPQTEKYAVFLKTCWDIPPAAVMGYQHNISTLSPEATS